MLTTKSIFKRYEEIRHRMPKTSTPEKFQDINSLLDIAEEGYTFVFDAFGVLNVGETLISGADKRLDQLRSIGCNIRILTNAASYDRNGAIEKFKRLGLSINGDEIVTSRDATLLCLGPGTWGAIAAPDDQLSDIPNDFIRIGHDPSDFGQTLQASEDTARDLAHSSRLRRWQTLQASRPVTHPHVHQYRRAAVGRGFQRREALRRTCRERGVVSSSGAVTGAVTGVLRCCRERGVPW